MKGQTESINFERDVIYFIFYISCFITFFPMLVSEAATRGVL